MILSISFSCAGGTLLSDCINLVFAQYKQIGIIMLDSLYIQFNKLSMHNSKDYKKHFNIVFIGQVNSGKSTLAGHLIHKCGSGNQNLFNAHQQEYYEVVGRKEENANSKYEWALEKIKMDSETYVQADKQLWQFEDEKNRFMIVQATGHKDFIKNLMIMKQKIDCAIVVVSSLQGQFESSIEQHGALRAQLILAKYLGVKYIIVCINKMDQKQIAFSYQRYSQIKTSIKTMLNQIQLKEINIDFIPISGKNGDNLFSKSPNSLWYKGATLMGALDKMEHENRSLKPLRVTIEDVYKIGGIGTVPVGRVECGILRRGMCIRFSPSGLSSEVNSVEMGHNYANEAEPGDSSGFNIKNLLPTDIKRGEIVGDPKHCPPIGINVLTGLITVLGNIKNIERNMVSVLHCHNARSECEIDDIVSVIDRRDGKIKGKNAQQIKRNESGIVVIKLANLISCEKLAQYWSLGKFILKVNGLIIAAGIII